MALGIAGLLVLYNNLNNLLPEDSRCYAWSHAIEGSEKRRFVAVLHEGPVDSTQAAVRAAIVQE